MAPIRHRALVSAVCVVVGLAFGVFLGLFFAFAGLIATPGGDAVAYYASGQRERNAFIAFVVGLLLGAAVGGVAALLVDLLRRQQQATRAARGSVPAPGRPPPPA